MITAATAKNKPTHIKGLDSWGTKDFWVLWPESRKDTLRNSPPDSEGRAGVGGSALKISFGSIFKDLQTLEASALAKTASGKRSMRSFSRASIFLTGTFSDTAKAAICRPASSLALRSIVPADVSPMPARPTLGSFTTDAARSFIKSAPLKSSKLARLTKAFFQLPHQLLHRIAVFHSTLHLDTQP